MTGSWGTAQDLEALEWADYCRRELKTDNFTIKMYGKTFQVHHTGRSVTLYENNKLSAFMGDDDFPKNLRPSGPQPTVKMPEDEILRRVKPVLEDISETIGFIGYSGYSITQLPHPYRGWLDWIDGSRYCTIFDLENASGRELRDLFSRSKKGNDYDFRPTSLFSFRGRLIGQGGRNNLEWYVLQS